MSFQQNKNNFRDIKDSTVIINQDNSNESPKISDQYSPEMYCSRKKSFSMLTNQIALIVSFLADAATLIAFIPATENILAFMKNLHIDNHLGIFMLIYALLMIVLYTITSNLLSKISNLKRIGIYRSYYFLGDDIYQLIPKECPKCHAKIYIKNSNGCITFCCCRSNSHSKIIDITELDNLPLMK